MANRIKKIVKMGFNVPSSVGPIAEFALVKISCYLKKKSEEYWLVIGQFISDVVGGQVCPLSCSIIQLKFKK